MTRAALKLAPALLSPERETLREAIADASPVRAEADKARARAEAARGALAAALAAVPAVERSVEAEKGRHVANPGADKGELRRLRSALADAVDDLALAKGVVERVEADLVTAERSASYAADSVERAAQAVIVAAFPPLIEAAERAAQDAAALAFPAQWVGSNGNNFDGEAHRLTIRAETLNPHLAFGSDGAAADRAKAAAQAPWIAARAALLTDPAAKLPEV